MCPVMGYLLSGCRVLRQLNSSSRWLSWERKELVLTVVSVASNTVNRFLCDVIALLVVVRSVGCVVSPEVSNPMWLTGLNTSTN